MTLYIFIPDTHKKAGLGHFYRCLRYSSYLSNSSKIYFLINKTFPKFNIKNHKKKINYFFYKKIKSSFLNNFKKNKRKILIIDSYNKKMHNLNLINNYTKKISITDFKINNNSNINIDHTFKRKKKFYKLKTYQKLFTGHQFFPIQKKKSKIKKKDIILIDFGSNKSLRSIKESIFFLKKIKKQKNIKIIIVNKFVQKKNVRYFKNLIDNKILHFRHVDNFENIYNKTLFSIGACGISLYERSFYHIPSIAKSVALNQNYNFKNFLEKRCILDYYKIINLKNNRINNFYIELNKVKKNLIKIFNKNKNDNQLKRIFSNL